MHGAFDSAEGNDPPEEGAAAAAEGIHTHTHTHTHTHLHGYEGGLARGAGSKGGECG